MSTTNHGAKSATEEALGRQLAIQADDYAHRSAEPFYELGDELRCGSEDVDLAHVWKVYSNLEESHALVFSDLEALVDTDPMTFGAISEAKRLAVALALVGKQIDAGDDDSLRHKIDGARWALEQAEEFLDELEAEL
jgi:hypothetical protein